AAGGTAALTYTGAAVGANEYISAILTDAAGSAVYYGRLTQPDEADGTLTFTVPADLAVGSYALKVFSEQYNDDYKTDYASAFSDVALTVISELDAAKAAAKAELENYKDPADYRADEQTDLAAAIADGEAAIDAAADIDAVAAALENAEAVIDEIKTDAELTAEEAAAKPDAPTAAPEDSVCRLCGEKHGPGFGYWIAMFHTWIFFFYIFIAPFAEIYRSNMNRS
nr:hypothetical protein [Clostridia bacterium]